VDVVSEVLTMLSLLASILAAINLKLNDYVSIPLKAPKYLPKLAAVNE